MLHLDERRCVSTEDALLLNWQMLWCAAWMRRYGDGISVSPWPVLAASPSFTVIDFWLTVSVAASEVHSRVFVSVTRPAGGIPPSLTHEHMNLLLNWFNAFNAIWLNGHLTVKGDGCVFVSSSVYLRYAECSSIIEVHLYILTWHHSSGRLLSVEWRGRPLGVQADSMFASQVLTRLNCKKSDLGCQPSLQALLPPYPLLFLLLRQTAALIPKLHH